MRVHVIGLGGAGGRIIDRLAADSDGDRFLQGLNAFDTDAAALDALRSIDESRRYRFGDAAGGGGLDGDLHAARRLGDAHASELGRAIDDQQPSLAEAFVLVVGLGGGAGAGVAPALAEELTRLYDVPIYAVGLLPTPAESEPDEPGKADSPRTAGDDSEDRPPKRPLAEKNAARTLNALSDRCAAIVPFDNDDWLRPGETLVDARDRLNGVVAERIAALFGAGEADDAASTPQQVLDASDVARAVGDDGEIAAIGHATQAVEPPESGSRFGLGLFGSSEPAEVDTSAAVSAIETTIRKAARGKNTVEVPDGRADRTLLVVGGPPAWLNREAIADGRRWLADETGSGAILTGDAPVPGGDEVFALVVRSGIDESTRIREIRESIA
ncbi:FtsZ/tubulin family protein [Halorubrum lacusprofundi]|jgi:cell division GTPase FtsZ|uniref:Tubulin-like protein CetZ n=1 Tax=Halorubrum lacusprofundi (strain ATCC 49239 / DSM 5036 / JCM 8891 / ACAM 34) TaxID=416348 RepID=B9LUE3_HALLT|nr:cell division protein FtsZ [Halorubrum lacusprofundi]ACM56300.1 Tubulin/FtsZ GTPase [Halorubrum lacusprofundi ATCC 49239]MCG1005392.1 cell division protein FtsZ [Halorubrum lacusprofundi]